MQQPEKKSGPDMSQLSAVRQKRLLEVVRERGAISVRELCELLQVSDATIRRDLVLLDEKGLLSRTHGGVVANSIVNFDLPNSQRALINEDEKQRICAAAIDMLEGNETVMIDAGTTSLSLALHAKRKPECRYVTTSLDVAQILRDQGIDQHYLIGGSYHPLNGSYCGSIATSTIRSLSFDVAFLCVSAIDIPRRAISLGSEMYCQVQKEIIEVSRRNVVIADHSKFRASAFMQTASFDNLDTIITDSAISDAARLGFENDKLELRIV